MRDRATVLKEAMDANPAVPINERRGAERGRRNARRVAPVDPQLELDDSAK